VDWGLLGLIALGLLAVWALLIALLWLLRPRDVRLRELIRIVPDLLRLVRDLLADSNVPLAARIAPGGLLVWLLNPIDLIPEFIPVLGPLDDVIVAVLVCAMRGGRAGSRTSGDDDLARRKGSPY